jgi:hypothetical protein
MDCGFFERADDDFASLLYRPLRSIYLHFFLLDHALILSLLPLSGCLRNLHTVLGVAFLFHKQSLILPVSDVLEPRCPSLTCLVLLAFCPFSEISLDLTIIFILYSRSLPLFSEDKQSRDSLN